MSLADRSPTRTVRYDRCRTGIFLAGISEADRVAVTSWVDRGVPLTTVLREIEDEVGHRPMGIDSLRHHFRGVCQCP